MTTQREELAAKAIMRANGYERFINCPGVFNTQLWRRALLQAKAVIAVLESGD